MIIGVGVDVCSIDRFAAMAKRSAGAVAKVLTSAEAATSPASQAVRFAAKEALAKALGATGLRWLDCEVVSDDAGQPQFAVTGSVQARCAELGVTTIHLSLSHDAGVAVAFVVCEGS